MALPASDTFDTDSDPLSSLGDWGQCGATADSGQALSGAVADNSGNSNDKSAYWVSDTFGDDQYAEITIGAFSPTSSRRVGVILRGGAGNEAILLRYTCGAGENSLEGYYYNSGGSRISLGSGITPSATMGAGDIIRAEISGDTLTVKVDYGAGFVTEGTFDATDGPDSGSAGLYIVDAGTTVVSISDWAAGNLGSSPDVTGSGAPSVPSLTVSGSGSVSGDDVSGSGAPSMPALTVSGVGTAITSITGSGSLSVPALTTAGTGTVPESPDVYVVGGSVSLDVPGPVTSSGTGTRSGSVTGTSAASFAALSLSGTGSVTSTITGSGNLTLAALTTAGTAGVVGTVSGSGSIGLPSLTIESTGSAIGTLSGSGTPSLPAVTVAGTGSVYTPQLISGSGAITLPSVTAFGQDIPPWGEGPFITELDWFMYRRRKLRKWRGR